MATGTIKDEHQMTLYGYSNYTQWLTLASGISPTNTTSSITIRHVEENIWYIYVSVGGTFAANTTTTIGTINQSFFPAPVTAYIPAFSFSGSYTYPAMGRATAAGVLDVCCMTASTQVNLQGFLVSREV